MATAKNLNYLKAYYKSLINKILKSNKDIDIESLIDSLIDPKEFEIQLYLTNDKILAGTSLSTCSRCKKIAPGNSSFCPNCCMKKFLFDKYDLIKKDNTITNCNYYIMLDNLIIVRKDYESFVASNCKELKKLLKAEYKKE